MDNLEQEVRDLKEERDNYINMKIENQDVEVRNANNIM